MEKQKGGFGGIPGRFVGEVALRNSEPYTPTMAKNPNEPRDEASSDAGDHFARIAGERSPGFAREFWDFLRQNRKWWLTPILVILALLIVLVLLSQTPLAPFIYPFF